ncbi:MAG: hypothetical protein DRN37_04195 [Thermoplasmata archaeon]|nr:MAG: hypothetical protein DRN37_04195 [Thermoplasmata archaeon]
MFIREIHLKRYLSGFDDGQPRMSAMSAFRISEARVRAVVIIFSVTGVLLLTLMAYLAQPDELALGELEGSDGRKVRTKGTVVGQYFNEHGSSIIMIVDGNASAEVFIERSSENYGTGDVISATGEVLDDGYGITITVQSDRGIDVVRRASTLNTRTDVKVAEASLLNGTIVYASSGFGSGRELEVVMEEEGRTMFIDVDLIRSDCDLRSGDIVRMEGLMYPGGRMICFGEGSVEVLSRPEPATSALLSVIEGAALSPSDLPGGKMDLKAYIRYEPSSRTIYVSDEPAGSLISIKVLLPERNPLIHMGDLVELHNTTFRWDAEQVRYTLLAESAEVISPHGPWRVDLSNLEYGVSPYEGAMVLIEGYIVREGDAVFVVDDGAKLEMRGTGEYVEGERSEVRGRIRMDPEGNAFYLEACEDVQ